MPKQLCLPGLDAPGPPWHNVYFAIRPDRTAAARASRFAWSLHDQHGFRQSPVDPTRLHISLLGFGTHPWPRPELIRWARQVAARVALPSFEVALDRVATFHGPPDRLPVVLLERRAVAALSLLRATIGAAVTRTSVELWLRSRYRPHLTLLYGGRPVREQAVPAIGWPVREFVLVCRRGPRDHATLGSWPLHG